MEFASLVYWAERLQQSADPEAEVGVEGHLQDWDRHAAAEGTFCKLSSAEWPEAAPHPAVLLSPLGQGSAVPIAVCAV